MINRHVFTLGLALLTVGAVSVGTASGAEAATKQKQCWSVECKKKKTVQSKKKKPLFAKTSTKKKKFVQSKKKKKYVQVAKKSNKKAIAKRNKQPVTRTVRHKTKKNVEVASLNRKVTGSHALSVADNYVGLSERGHKRQLMGLFSFAFNHKIDPARTPWCAAFVNSVLRKTGKKGTGSLAAASFRSWGKGTRNPKAGDVVVMKGHVGFYVGTVKRNGRTYVAVLGGNQSNKVKVTYYKASRVVAYRTAG